VRHSRDEGEHALPPISRRRSTARGVLVGIATAAAVLRLSRLAFFFVTVVGPSMVPTFDPGDRLIAVRRRLARPLRVGDVVVLRPPPTAGRRLLVKRIAALEGMAVPGRPQQSVPSRSLWVLGDGRQSLDSRHFGAVDADEVVGLVIRRLWSDPR
jgi:signal peptidase I